jgi:ferric-dicitrate binding protein FerR (iron transport regulator)
MNIDKEILISYLNSETSEFENKQIFEWLNEDDKNLEDFLAIKESWEKFENRFVSINKSKAFEKIGNKIENSKPRQFLGILKYAVVIAITFISTFAYFEFSNLENIQEEISYTRIHCPKGERTKISLSDGTEVWLASESDLRFPSSFKGTDLREVELWGQAYFEVEKSKEKMFVVKTNDYDVRVYGTKFNVRNYGYDEKSEVSLYEGKIAFKVEDKDEILLNKSDKLIFNKQKSKYAISKTSADDLFWKYGFMNFSNANLYQIAKKIEKYYNVKIKIIDYIDKSIRFTGKFDNETVYDALEALEHVYPITYNKNKNNITIKKKI